MSKPNQQSDWETYKRILSYVKPYKFAFVLSFIGFGLFAASGPLLAKVAGMIEVAINNEALVGESRYLIPAVLISAYFLRGIGSFLGTYNLAFIARNVVHKMRCNLVNHLIDLPINYFDKNSTGHILSKISYNVEQVTASSSSALTVLMREGLTVIALVGYMLYLNWQLTLIFLVCAPLIGYVVTVTGRYFRRYSSRIQSSMGDVTHVASEVVKGYRVIKMYGGEVDEKQRFADVSELNKKQNLKLAATSAFSSPVIQLLVALAMSFLIWLAFSPVFLSTLGGGIFLQFITAAGMIAKPVKQLSDVNASIQKGIAGAMSIFEILDTPRESNDAAAKLSNVEGGVTFDNLSFVYPNSDASVLKNINLDVKPGMTVALVGRSGSGKSSLVNLLPRFYNNYTGVISIDGVDTKTVSLDSLRHNISIVSQQVTLFNDTIANNIAYGELATATREQIIQAAEKAHAMEFIELLPDGLDTEVGDDGNKLSGGQRQRVVIARALLKNAPLLIFDEATSALDNESERHIQAAIDEVVKGRTTFVIAHRLSTIERADLICVVDKGQIVEQGTHESLLMKGGVYKHLHDMQHENDFIQEG